MLEFGQIYNRSAVMTTKQLLQYAMPLCLFFSASVSHAITIEEFESTTDTGTVKVATCGNKTAKFVNKTELNTHMNMVFTGDGIGNDDTFTAEWRQGTVVIGKTPFMSGSWVQSNLQTSSEVVTYSFIPSGDLSTVIIGDTDNSLPKIDNGWDAVLTNIQNLAGTACGNPAAVSKIYSVAARLKSAQIKVDPKKLSPAGKAYAVITMSLSAAANDGTSGVILANKNAVKYTYTAKGYVSFH